MWFWARTQTFCGFLCAALISDENWLETSRVLISETVFKEAKLEFLHILSAEPLKRPS